MSLVLYISVNTYIHNSDLNRTSKQKADEMKRQIREKIVRMLGTYLFHSSDKQ